MLYVVGEQEHVRPLSLSLCNAPTFRFVMATGPSDFVGIETLIDFDIATSSCSRLRVFPDFPDVLLLLDLYDLPSIESLSELECASWPTRLSLNVLYAFASFPLSSSLPVLNVLWALATLPSSLPPSSYFDSFSFPVSWTSFCSSSMSLALVSDSVASSAKDGSLSPSWLKSLMSSLVSDSTCPPLSSPSPVPLLLPVSDSASPSSAPSPSGVGRGSLFSNEFALFETPIVTSSPILLPLPLPLLFPNVDSSPSPSVVDGSN
mmetsp:Transcript_6410/g.13052  ORF Transcript_6410/g.13052 Transcript_6410/m.13052 type:complete len:262 (+) Transcript_6410:632-1417(+)